MLGVMFSGRHNLQQQEDGSYFIDRDGEGFKCILMYLRDPTAAFIHVSRLDEAQQFHLRLVANYFLLPKLEEVLQQALDCRAAVREKELSRNIMKKVPLGNVTVSAQATKCTSTQYTLDYYIVSSKIIEYHYHYVQRCEVVHELEYGELRVHNFAFTEHVVLHNCNLSWVEFRCCIFKKGASFEGSFLRDTVFENVSGLVTHQVHFTPRQVAQAKFQPELLDALKANGCIY